jgi:hypothetical protein
LYRLVETCGTVRTYIGYPANRECAVSKPSHADRLRDQIRAFREVAWRTPAGPERDMLLRRAEQDEIALRLLQWATDPAQIDPPSDLVPVTRHRLRRD